MPGLGHSRWTELNIGPFYIYTEGDVATARDNLTQLEQLRWVLGNLLDAPDLPSLWPIRIILTKTENTNPPSDFVRQSVPLFGQRTFVWKSGTPLPLPEVAQLLIDDNTPRIPAEAESGLCRLLGSIQARGSRVSWGGPVPQPDLAWATMQLFATKFEYSASFHVFVTSLKNGSSVRVAERNAFNRDPDALEKEAAANLASGHWEAVSVSGRPLDPKRDLGEHATDDAIVNAYVAAALIGSDPKAADAAFKAAIEAGGAAKALGYEGLEDYQAAIDGGSKSAPAYLASAKDLSKPQTLARLKQAAAFNPRWAEPIHTQALLTDDPLQREALLKRAAQLAPREASYWVELAELQMTDGHAEASRSSWIRAEDATAPGPERDRIHELRLSKEEQRLEAAAADSRRERDEARLADQHAQDSEMARIHAAEQKANASLDAEAGGEKPEQVVPWQDTVPKHTTTGTLVKVECGKTSDRLTIHDRAGHTLQLTLADPSKLGLACGAQTPARRVSVTYADDKVVSLELK